MPSISRIMRRHQKCIQLSVEMSRSRSFSKLRMYEAVASSVETLSDLWVTLASQDKGELTRITSRMLRKSSTHLLIVLMRFFSASLCCIFFCWFLTFSSSLHNYNWVTVLRLMCWVIRGGKKPIYVYKVKFALFDHYSFSYRWIHSFANDQVKTANNENKHERGNMYITAKHSTGTYDDLLG